MKKNNSKSDLVKKSEIDKLQAKINEKFKDNCHDSFYLLEIDADIAAGLTAQQIENVLNETEDCSTFRKNLEGLRYKGKNK